MGACGAGYGSLDSAFADRVELEFVHAELQALLPRPPSREVVREEHRRKCERLGRRVPYRELLRRLTG